jgi:DNA-directed RNA polymerase I, II, and III subunit RPABC1
MSFSLRPTEEMIAKYQEPPTDKRPTPPPAPIGTVWVEYNDDPQIGVKQVRTFAQHIDANNFYTGILVTAVPVSPSAQKVASAIAPKILEFFQESDLIVNITLHDLVPKHVLLSVDEKKQLLERYRLKDSQLPRIQRTDPVAKYLGLRRGQVIKIIRKSVTAGRYASYRWVIG